MPTTIRRRRPLSASAGRVLLHGPAEAAERLREALTVPPLPEHLEEEERALVEQSLSVHQFHSFAARAHPLMVRLLLREARPGQVVLDPFVGSGTVLVEAALQGAAGVGVDVGALQVRLSRFKATPMPPTMRQALLQRAAVVSEASQQRVKQRRRPQRRWDDPSHYEPHVYLELAGLREEIGGVAEADAPLGEALLLVLSSLVIKASRQRAESTLNESPRSIGKGQVSRWFLRRAEELVRQLAAFAERVPRGTPPPRLHTGDARAGLPGAAAGSIDVVLTSPPYLGVYDYAAHHARRCAWLGIDPQEAQRAEIGVKRAPTAPHALPALLTEHQKDTDAWVAPLGRLLRPGGDAYIIVGDAALGPERVAGDEPVLAAAARAGLQLVAACAVERPHPLWRDGDSRYEHLLHLRRGPQ